MVVKTDKKIKIPINILYIKDRAQFRQWLIENHATERECWVVAKRGKTPPEDALWYLLLGLYIG